MTTTSPLRRQPVSLTRFAWLSIAAALITLTLKMVAYALTGSVGLLSDALESLVNLAAAIMALAMLHVAAQPPDDEHAYGHSKAEYFSSALEGLLILIAAAGIAWTAFPRLFDPHPIDDVGLGMAISVGASLVNLAVARVLMRAGREHHSITLEAGAHHLMTDVWTSAGVLAAVALVALTGWFILDPVIALLVAANIVWTGIHLMYRSVTGLMDTALPRRSWRRSGTFWTVTRNKGLAIRICAHASPGPANSSPYMCRCPATGPCNAAMTCWTRLRTRSGWRCPTPTS